MSGSGAGVMRHYSREWSLVKIIKKQAPHSRLMITHLLLLSPGCYGVIVERSVSVVTKWILTVNTWIIVNRGVETSDQ